MGYFLQQFAIFLFYSFLGWVCETVFCSLAARKFINRGFLSGPFCPIYGFGALLVILLFSGLQNHVLLLFVCSMVGASALEYLTSFLLEKLFRLRLWDYSNRKWNLHGRVCLRNSLLFGVMAVLMVTVIHPYVSRWMAALPETVLWVGFLFLAAYFLLDTGVTVYALLTIRRQTGQSPTELEGLAALRNQVLSQAQEKRRQRRQKRLQALYRRLEKAFPRMKPLGDPEALRRLLEEARAAAREKSRRHKR